MKHSYFTKLSGTSFRQETILKCAPFKTNLRCVAHPDNEYDQFAVEVQALTDKGWEQIGWIRKGENEEISKYLQSGGDVLINLSDITGLDKDTKGVNVGIVYGIDDSVDPEMFKDMTPQKVAYGDTDYVFFDEANHKAYDEDGHLLLSGSQAEHKFLKDVDLTYPARALAKSTDCFPEDFLKIWEHNRDLAASYGTTVHAALETYFKYHKIMEKADKHKERDHTAKNWMPEHLGAIVDLFIKTSGYKEAEVEIRIKFGNRTGIVDCLTKNDDGTYTLNDYKITKQIKDVKYEGFGKHKKYTVQQNFYREILEEAGLVVKEMLLWQYDGSEWTKHKLEKINVKESL